jgi:Putative transposase of IS4/5 family (DUF4096)
VIDGIFFRTRAGCPWRDLPERFGNWKTVYNRHRGWSGDGTWEMILGRLRADCDREALGRSRGGLTSKIHLLADSGCRPLAPLTSAGQRHDSVAFLPLMDQFKVESQKHRTVGHLISLVAAPGQVPDRQLAPSPCSMMHGKALGGDAAAVAAQDLLDVQAPPPPHPAVQAPAFLGKTGGRYGQHRAQRVGHAVPAHPAVGRPGREPALARTHDKQVIRPAGECDQDRPRLAALHDRLDGKVGGDLAPGRFERRP